MARTRYLALVVLLLAACVRVRTEVGTDRADAGLLGAAVAQPATPAVVDPILDALRTVGFGWSYRTAF